MAAGEPSSRDGSGLAPPAQPARRTSAEPRPEQVEAVLAGTAAYDDLGDEEQAVVRAAWEERIAERLATREHTTELVAAGEPWWEADAEGTLVLRHPPGSGDGRTAP